MEEEKPNIRDLLFVSHAGGLANNNTFKKEEKPVVIMSENEDENEIEDEYMN